MQNDAFFLMKDASDPEKYRFEITEFFLSVPTAELNDKLYDQIERSLSKKDAVLNFRRREAIPYQIPKGSKTYFSTALWPPEQMPCKTAVVFCRSTAYYGNYLENPWDFRATFGSDCYMENMVLSLNGVSVDALPCDDEMMRFIRLNLYSEFLGSVFSNDITLQDFRDGYHVSAGSQAQTGSVHIQ